MENLEPEAVEEIILWTSSSPPCLTSGETEAQEDKRFSSRTAHHCAADKAIQFLALRDSSLPLGGFFRGAWFGAGLGDREAQPRGAIPLHSRSICQCWLDGHPPRGPAQTVLNSPVPGLTLPGKAPDSLGKLLDHHLSEVRGQCRLWAEAVRVGEFEGPAWRCAPQGLGAPLLLGAWELPQGGVGWAVRLWGQR